MNLLQEEWSSQPAVLKRSVVFFEEIDVSTIPNTSKGHFFGEPNVGSYCLCLLQKHVPISEVLEVP